MTPEQHARVKEIFAQAILLSAQDRHELLHQPSVDEVVRSEVLSLLKFHSTETLLPAEHTKAAENHPTVPLTPLATRLTKSTPAFPAGSRSPRTTSARFENRLRTLGPTGQLAIGVITACLILGLVGLLTNLATDHATRELRESKLRSSLASTVHAIKLWIEQEKLHAQLVTQDPELRRAASELAGRSQAGEDRESLRQSPSQAAIRHQMHGTLGPDVRYALWDRRLVTIADWTEDAVGVGDGVTAYGGALLARIFDGEIIVQVPGIHQPITKNYPFEPMVPRVWIMAPVRDEQNNIQAAILIYNLGAESRFNEILAMLKIGRTGEAFAFDQNGLLLSESRFIKELQRAGLVQEEATPLSALRVYVRDPEVDLTRGGVAKTPVSEWPMTRMARMATRGQNGLDLDGYRSYLGVSVVGAWQWLDEQQFGVATEISVEEVNAPLRYMHVKSVVVFGLLTVSLLAAIWSHQRLASFRRNVGPQSQLGQYTLEEKVGEGGMGVVYRARHELLRRPTAIKMLKADVTNARTIHWFEREVQLASQLTHPNTIEIYDYGVTPEGIFYYAMEFLAGQTLAQLVQASGPIQPQRATQILTQMAGSLREAHQAGIVHRDIKPQNVMLCERGGEVDVVKVLDFGLVKPVQAEADAVSTMLAGTPMYMAPERLRDLRSNDIRSDIYSWGAVGFYLLTGRDIFADDSSQSLLERIMFDTPPLASECVSEPIPHELDQLIADCLAKDLETRPQSMQEVLKRLHGETQLLDLRPT